MFKLLIACFALAFSTAASQQLPGRGDLIFADADLPVGKKYFSQDRTAYLIVQTDGNLVLYRQRPDGTQVKPIWDAGTVGANARTRLQSDGNLVVYMFHGGAYWAANTDAKKRGRSFRFAVGAQDVWLQVQDDHNVVIYGGQYPNGLPVWSTETAGK